MTRPGIELWSLYPLDQCPGVVAMEKGSLQVTLDYGEHQEKLTLIHFLWTNKSFFCVEYIANIPIVPFYSFPYAYYPYGKDESM